MASADDKRRQVERHLRQARHHLDRDEARQRQESSKARKAARRGSGRRRGWDEEDEETFEKIQRSSSGGVARSAQAPDPESLPWATVAAVHQSQVEILTEGDAEEGPERLRARVAHRLLVDPEFRLTVGDKVAFSRQDDQARVELLLPRESSLQRSDPGRVGRTLLLAANVDLAVLVVAVADPPLREGLIDRLLMGLAQGGVAPLVCAHKIDLLDGSEREALATRLAPYRELEVPVLCCAAETGEGIEALRGAIAGKTCVFVGHSGVGKSSLLNALDPAGDRAVGAVRDKDGRGRHTTTGSQLRDLGQGTRVIDTPGVRAFGLDSLDLDRLRDGFAEFAPLASRCAFADCRHDREPDCAVRAAAEGGALSAARYSSYRRLLGELDAG